MKKRKDFRRLGNDAQAPLWLSPDGAWTLLALLEPGDAKVRISQRIFRQIKTGLDDMMKDFESSLHRYLELEKRLKANGFWEEDKGTRALLVVRNIRAGQRANHKKTMSALASAGPAKVKKIVKRMLRGGTNR